MARALLPASFVREAPTNNQSVVPVTNDRTLSCPCPSQKRKNFVSRARSRSAALRGSFRLGPESSWAGLRSANANASAATPTRAGAGPLRRLGLCDPPQQPHCPPTHATGREGGPGNTGNGFLQPSKKKGNTGRVCGDPLPSLPLSLCAGFLPGPRSGTCSRHPHRGSPQRSRAHAVDELFQQGEERPCGPRTALTTPDCIGIDRFNPGHA